MAWLLLTLFQLLHVLKVIGTVCAGPAAFVAAAWGCDFIDYALDHPWLHAQLDYVDAELAAYYEANIRAPAQDYWRRLQAWAIPRLAPLVRLARKYLWFLGYLEYAKYGWPPYLCRTLWRGLCHWY